MSTLACQSKTSPRMIRNLVFILIAGIIFSSVHDADAGCRRFRCRCSPGIAWNFRVRCNEPCQRVTARPLPTVQFVSPKGTRYATWETDDPGSEEEFARELAEELRRMSPADRLAAANTENFIGHDRKAAKTSIATADVESFDDLRDLLGSLPDDEAMLNHNPPITEDEGSDRVDEEERNVSIACYLFATKKEADNDYHLILGEVGSHGPHSLMTAEVSGLPRTGPTRTRLKIPREAFQEYFADQPIGSRYRVFDPPIPVKVTGSLFFDVDHPAGAVGPTGMRPRTAWEIHPVTEITLEP